MWLRKTRVSKKRALQFSVIILLIALAYLMYIWEMLMIFGIQYFSLLRISDASLKSYGEPKSYVYNLLSNNNFSIVKRVHFLSATASVQIDYRPFLQTWRRVYPEFELYFWTDDDILQLVKRRYIWFEKFYADSNLNGLERSDVARVLILHSFGGWYSDLDAGCFRRADDIMRRYRLLIPLEPYAHSIVNFRFTRIVNNAIMYSISNHEFWLHYLNFIVENYRTFKVENDFGVAVQTTGPVALTKAVTNCQKLRDCGDEGDRLCPTIAQPWKFNPFADNATDDRILENYKFYCLGRKFRMDYHRQDCDLMQSHQFQNFSPKHAYTFHRFLHLYRKREVKWDHVHNWKELKLRLKPLDYLTVKAKVQDDV